MADLTPALDRATEALPYAKRSVRRAAARAAVSAALHDPDDAAWPLSVLDPLPLPVNIRDWSPAMRDAYGAAATEHGFTEGNEAARRVFMNESAARLRAAILGEP